MLFGSPTLSTFPFHIPSFPNGHLEVVGADTCGSPAHIFTLICSSRNCLRHIRMSLRVIRTPTLPSCSVRIFHDLKTCTPARFSNSELISLGINLVGPLGAGAKTPFRGMHFWSIKMVSQFYMVILYVFSNTAFCYKFSCLAHLIFVSLTKLHLLEPQLRCQLSSLLFNALFR